ncbi:MAG: phytanoyl-CoA dioxygenase family protein [Abditibacteriaceae bacterium]
MTTSNPILTDKQKQDFTRDGYVIVRGLIPDDVVRQTRDDLMDSLGAKVDDSATWKSQPEVGRWMWTAGPLTEKCRSREVEQVVEELAGPHFLRGISFHPGKESVGLEARELGYIPVLTSPKVNGKDVVPPIDWHVDGINGTDITPSIFMMVIFVYLTDTAADGGATTVRPGSHRQLFAHWTKNGMGPIDALEYSQAIPLAGKAGDVIFFHYLLVHRGSQNHSDHLRVGLNTAVHQDPQHPYQMPQGAPNESWTPFDFTLRTDNIEVEDRVP